MANLIIKPASASDDLKLQDGAGADIVTVDTNNVLFGKGIQETKGTSTNSGAALSIDLATGNFFEIDLQNNNATVTSWTFSNMAASGKVSSWITSCFIVFTGMIGALVKSSSPSIWSLVVNDGGITKYCS